MRQMSPRSSNAADYQHIPRPVAAMPKQFADGHRIDWHRHPRSQLLFAIKGTMSIRTPRQLWVVPPLRALWVPGMTDHEVTMSGLVDMRTLYVEPAQSVLDAVPDVVPDAVPRTAPKAVPMAGRQPVREFVNLPAECVAMEVSPLLRELIVRATEMPTLYDDQGTEGLVIRLLLDEMVRAPILPLSLPLPPAGELGNLCAHLLANPMADATLQSCAASLGMSSRTLARRFIDETGLTFGQWRQRSRIHQAITRLSQGDSITAIALDVGYESPSAFTAMFRKTMGAAPSAMFGRATGRSNIVGTNAND